MAIVTDKQDLEYVIDMFQYHLDNTDHSLGCDKALAMLKDMAGQPLTEIEQDLL